METVAVTDGSPTRTGWKRRSKAGSCACCFYLWGGGGGKRGGGRVVSRKAGRKGRDDASV